MVAVRRDRARCRTGKRNLESIKGSVSDPCDGYCSRSVCQKMAADGASSLFASCALWKLPTTGEEEQRVAVTNAGFCRHKESLGSCCAGGRRPGRAAAAGAGGEGGEK